MCAIVLYIGNNNKIRPINANETNQSIISIKYSISEQNRTLKTTGQPYHHTTGCHAQLSKYISYQNPCLRFWHFNCLGLWHCNMSTSNWFQNKPVITAHDISICLRLWHFRYAQSNDDYYNHNHSSKPMSPTQVFFFFFLEAKCKWSVQGYDVHVVNMFILYFIILIDKNENQGSSIVCFK